MRTTLIASVTTGRGSTVYRKVLTSDGDIFVMPDDLTTSIVYNPGAALEDNEWFKLTNFSSKSFCLPLLQQNSFSSVNFDSITASDFGKIVFLCEYRDGKYFFQRVTLARQVKRRIIKFGDYCEYETNSSIISLNDYADAIYNKTEDILYFRKLRDVTAIFDGIDELYREATEEEIEKFLNLDFIKLNEGFTSVSVKTNNRKRIAMALETLGRFSRNEKKTVFEYIKDYCPELVNKNSKFNIHNEDSLKKLLYGIEQRYYTTLVGNEKRVANSILTMS